MLIKILIASLISLTSIYTLTIEDLNGNTVDLNDFSGKQLLIVNIATRSQYTSQIQELEQLRQLYSNELVIIAVPSNSFGNEPHSNAALKQLFIDSFQVGYKITKLAAVNGASRHAVYGWMSDSTQNGSGSFRFNRDFQKVLINRSGKITGVFNSMVTPLNDKITTAIEKNKL